MVPKRVIELCRKAVLSESESAELNVYMKEWSRTLYRICPICGGAFSLPEVTSHTFQCPVCFNGLESCSSEILPHERFEIDRSCEEIFLHGEYAIWSYPVGCTPCPCGIHGVGYYPASYTCCPSLLVLAASMFSEGNQPAFDFLCQHQQTLLNALRGNYRSIFNTDHLLQFCGDERLQESGPLLRRITEIIESREPSSRVSPFDPL